MICTVAIICYLQVKITRVFTRQYYHSRNLLDHFPCTRARVFLSKAQFFCRYEKFVYGFCVKQPQTASIADAAQRPDTFFAYFVVYFEYRFSVYGNYVKGNWMSTS